MFKIKYLAYMCVGYMKKTFARHCLCGKCLFKAIEFIVNYLPTSYSVIEC